MLRHIGSRAVCCFSILSISVETASPLNDFAVYHPGHTRLLISVYMEMGILQTLLFPFSRLMKEGLLFVPGYPCLRRCPFF